MTVYIDDANIKTDAGLIMSHMIADTEEELDAMASRIGLRVDWKHRRRNGTVHYDVCLTKKKLAIIHGAKQVSQRQLAVIQLLNEWIVEDSNE